MDEFGFIILRHVNNKTTNNYWQNCYKCIRKFYPKRKIIIIDDNSNYQFITNIELYNCFIIQSEYPKRGELLPFIYYLKYKFFDKAVILHDSVFINTFINFNIKENYKFIWDFSHQWDNTINDIKLIKVFKNQDLLQFYKNKDLWRGCFGGMCIISYNYLLAIDNHYPFQKLINIIITREDRCSFERILGCLLSKLNKSKPLLGDIHKYCKWGGDSRGIGLDKWMWKPRNDKIHQIINNKHLPIIKIWTGR